MLVKFTCCCCLLTKSCPTLCYPMDYSLSGSSVHGVSQARILKWVAISSSRNLPDPGIESASPAWQVDSLLLSHLGSPGKIYLWREKQPLSNMANPLICSSLSHWLVLVFSCISVFPFSSVFEEFQIPSKPLFVNT